MYYNILYIKILWVYAGDRIHKFFECTAVMIIVVIGTADDSCFCC